MRAVVTCLLAATLTLAPPLTGWDSRARATPVSTGSVHVGVLGGFQITSDDADLTGRRELDTTVESAPWAGVRFGVGLARALSLELTAAVMPADTTLAGGSALAMHVFGEAIVHFIRGPVSLNLAAGAGVSALVAGNLGTDADLLVTVGPGLRWLLADRLLALRLDGRVLLSDGVDSTLAPSFLVALGLDIFLVRSEPRFVPPPPQPVAPDGDGDGTPDATDRCPHAPGPAEGAGCPDSDGDGLADADDACPETSGTRAFHGCPDTDGDGVPDTTDACPTLAGSERFVGCPDSDDDGVPDGEDRCPNLKGAADRAGCPEPSTEALALFGRPLDGVAFVRGRSALLPGSDTALEAVARTLGEHAFLEIEVQGHTHGRQSRDKARALSLERARAVVTRLVELGVDRSRLRAVGMGASRPVASNRSSVGRARNERIELHLVGR